MHWRARKAKSRKFWKEAEGLDPKNVLRAIIVKSGHYKPRGGEPVNIVEIIPVFESGARLYNKAIKLRCATAVAELSAVLADFVKWNKTTGYLDE